MVPRMSSLSHLKVVAVWPSFGSLQRVVPRIDLAQFPNLIWLKLCGRAPRQFLEIFAGQTASVQRCVIAGSLDFKNGSTNFFARISDGLRAFDRRRREFLGASDLQVPQVTLAEASWWI
jgi:hypothetical protein